MLSETPHDIREVDDKGTNFSKTTLHEILLFVASFQYNKSSTFFFRIWNRGNYKDNSVNLAGRLTTVDPTDRFWH